MPTAILYVQEKPSPDHQPITVVSAIGRRTLYIRAETHPSGNVLDALDAATPRPGETVLNTVPLTRPVTLSPHH